jgi:23S rRNA (cytidine1920-2'-O)/16S rRNA (cytidine1409-2'-O)-methyltransferase
MPKKRLDVMLVESGKVESRALAQRLVMAGRVRVDGQVVLKPAASISPDARLEIEPSPQFVSRGGEKLAAALQAFSLDVRGHICADVGASTGGFTDCLLQNGAARVYTIDVGKGILHWKLRQDQRVVVMEGANARHIQRLPEAIEIVTIDVSFISLKILLPVVKQWFDLSPPPELPSCSPAGPAAGQVIALIKPQFEAGRAEVARGNGVIRDPVVHRTVLYDVLKFAQAEGYAIRGLIRSPLLGPKGNAEFLAWLSLPKAAHRDQDSASLDEIVDSAIQQANE